MNILIAGLPKSGTTALFFKIANSIPGPYLPLFEPFNGQAVFQRPDLASVDLSKVTILSKILCVPHGVDRLNLTRLPDVDYPSFQFYDRKIFLVRDPRDNLVSLMLYMIVNTTKLIAPEHAGRLLSLLEKKEAKPAEVSVTDVLACMSAANECNFTESFIGWMQYGIEYTQQHADHCLFRYEQLVAEEFEALNELLGFPLVGAADVPQQLQRVARTKSSGNWRSWFTPTDVDQLRPLLDPILSARGYASDWELESSPKLPPKHGSEYVRRIVNERYAELGYRERV